MHAGYMESHFFEADKPTTSDQQRRGYTSSGFYFWDESEAYVVGPYQSFEEAEKARREYEP